VSDKLTGLSEERVYGSKMIPKAVLLALLLPEYRFFISQTHK
jgi:hypothetical protein